MVAIESRSPAEGAFSEGFENARLTQDGCIVCPSTRSTLDLKTGEIKDWYPDNPVLRRLTPIETCRPMEVFKRLARPDGVYVDVKNGSLGPDFVALRHQGRLQHLPREQQRLRRAPDGRRGRGWERDRGGRRRRVGHVQDGPGDARHLHRGRRGVGAGWLRGLRVLRELRRPRRCSGWWASAAAKVGLDATGALDEDK